MDFSILDRTILQLANPKQGGVAMLNYGPSVEFIFEPSGELIWAGFTLFTNAENPQSPSDIAKSYKVMHYGTGGIAEPGESKTKGEALDKPRKVSGLQTNFIGEERRSLIGENPLPLDFRSFSRFAAWYEKLPLKEIVDAYSTDSPPFYLFSSNHLLKEEVAPSSINIIYLDCSTPDIKEVNPSTLELAPSLNDPSAKYVPGIEFRDFDHCLLEPYYLQTESQVGIDEIRVREGKSYVANNILVLLRPKE
jgi:hypothetical protein